MLCFILSVLSFFGLSFSLDRFLFVLFCFLFSILFCLFPSIFFRCVYPFFFFSTTALCKLRFSLCRSVFRARLSSSEAPAVSDRAGNDCLMCDCDSVCFSRCGLIGIVFCCPLYVRSFVFFGLCVRCRCSW